MTQHRYPCECCGVYGTAHYRLRPAPEQPAPEELRQALAPPPLAPFVKVLLCKGCSSAKCDGLVPCRRFP